MIEDIYKEDDPVAEHHKENEEVALYSRRRDEELYAEMRD
tara:strand:- start:1550 stop:1669 length:120 start_codon:yes stop_codon:yes gene_type:complete